ncbi:MAG TPA: sugar transferase [Candidatus Obscuribacterales bacterium]
MSAARSHEEFRIQALQILDALLVFVAFWFAWDLRDVVLTLMDKAPSDEDHRQSVFWVLYIAVPFTPLVLERFGFYRMMRTKSAGRAAAQLFKGAAVMALFIGMFALFAKYTDVRRLALGIGFCNLVLLLFARDRLVFHYLSTRRLSDEAKERILLAGTNDETEALYGSLDEDIVAGWKVVDHFDLEQGSVEELYNTIKEHSIERVIFATGGASFEKVADAVEACELQGIEAWIAASFIRNQIARPAFDSLGDKPMLVLRSTPDLSWELLCKSLIDRFGAAILILLTSPLWIFSWLGIKITSPGAPAFFHQRRSGRYGKPFRMWKFRTMVPDAEAQLTRIKEEHGNEMEGPVFKLGRDPRVLPFGRLLRRFSIDELPQLYNVLRGDMSLVGPRPLPLYEVEAFSKHTHRRRLSVKPGITCEWQIAGRNDIQEFEDWVQLDLRYIDNWSLWNDLIILLKTVPAVIFGKGAK